MINLFEPIIPDESLDGVGSVFESKWLGRGQVVKKFETSLSLFLGADDAQITTMSCCSDAIFAILPVIKKHSNRKKVIVPAISFPAVGSAVIEAGLDLVIVDVDADTGNICMAALQQCFDDDVLAVFITHYGGNPVDISGLREFVGTDVFILEDSACALGSVLENGDAVGMHGDFSCWSFDAMKLLVTGEGGAARIGNGEVMTEFKESLYLGLPASEKSGLDRAGEAAEWWSYSLNSFGRRSVFSDINAAIGLPQFKTLSVKLDRREIVRKRYIGAINRNPSLQVTARGGCKTYSNYFFTVLSDQRNQLAAYLKNNDVYSTFRYYPLDKIELFRRNSVIMDLAGSNSFSSRALNIPIHDALTEADIDFICKLLEEYRPS